MLAVVVMVLLLDVVLVLVVVLMLFEARTRGGGEGKALNHVRGVVNVLAFLCRVGVINIVGQAVKSKRSSCRPGCKRDAAVELVGLCPPAVGSQ